MSMRNKIKRITSKLLANKHLLVLSLSFAIVFGLFAYYISLFYIGMAVPVKKVQDDLPFRLPASTHVIGTRYFVGRDPLLILKAEIDRKDVELIIRSIPKSADMVRYPNGMRIPDDEFRLNDNFWQYKVMIMHINNKDTWRWWDPHLSDDYFACIWNSSKTDVGSKSYFLVIALGDKKMKDTGKALLYLYRLEN